MCSCAWLSGNLSRLPAGRQVSLGTLITGGLDLSIAAVAAVTGMSAAALINAQVSGELAAILALLVAGALGAINGTIVVKFRINPIIATLGTRLLMDR